MKLRTPIAATLALLAVAAASGPDKAGHGGPVAWYGTWERGLRVAKETGRGILLIAGAPQCHGISGLW